MKTRRNTRSCSNSRNRAEKTSETIHLPFDLVIEIFMRLPAKSVARFHCLSKLCASTLSNPNFTDAFFIRSSSRPKLLFNCPKDGETFFFSSPKPRDDSSPLAVSFHKSFPINRPFDICRPVSGFVYGFNYHKTSTGRTVSVPLICNPSTGQSWTLPSVKTNRTIITSYFGYDPIDKEFKVLCMTQSYLGEFGEQKVLTLGTGKKLSWRKIKCDMQHFPCPVEGEPNHHYPLYDGICIDGVLYYLGMVRGDADGFPDIICFDIKSEKFSYVKKTHGMERNSGSVLEQTLVNYKGKIAKFQPKFDEHGTILTGIQLYVLEDAEKHQWSSYIYVMPPPWKSIVEETKLRFVGTSDTGEIVLSPYNISDSSYLLSYDPERNTLTKVGIKGMEALKPHKSYAFLDHVENVVKIEPAS
ncbi:putative F-box protein At1g20657 [Capsella rubella]|uniref:putative F-box protein At1g20657 n=1 Tax=Capsella rubella TaxID=81985 RepID=UPI000CD4B51D|nr:putative F-box protein At1g20657 [Capsella rubella]